MCKIDFYYIYCLNVCKLKFLCKEKTISCSQNKMLSYDLSVSMTLHSIMLNFTQ